jgi:hypothetical protein
VKDAAEDFVALYSARHNPSCTFFQAKPTDVETGACRASGPGGQRGAGEDFMKGGKRYASAIVHKQNMKPSTLHWQTEQMAEYLWLNRMCVAVQNGTLAGLCQQQTHCNKPAAGQPEQQDLWL